MDDTTNELTPTESWELLGTTDLGRLAMCFDGAPEIFPVNFVIANGTVVFRTAAGLKHVSARLGHPIALEADGLDREAGIAWSVVVKGRARDVTSQTELDFVRKLPLRPAHDGPKHIFVRIEPDTVTGRRFPIADADRWVQSERVSTPE
jgi:nitroimidazol reductase NimA-like FMN-containing flavoprotein (pyridoxamine 5'-phosphate oxidase superfamily)